MSRVAGPLTCLNLAHIRGSRGKFSLGVPHPLSLLCKENFFVYNLRNYYFRFFETLFYLFKHIKK